ncbi:hypothetical protein EV382_2539 [Micromonospora violae]|uniref:Integral membrane protein n=1 Tax=Micromonospora violae TaxID=1278207 RepID=A0A4Q7UGJ4_9ACTN|nr:hypothetical protein EV382_2539 [Micromonospora violae]
MTMMTRPGRPRSADLIILGAEVALLAVAAAVGALLNHQGVRLHADAAPLYASWQPHVGPGTPLALLVAAVVVWRGTRWGADAPWPRLLLVGYLASVLWTLSLALVDGWSAGLTERLTVQAEYLHEVPRVTDVGIMLSGFADRILDFQPDSWSTHTAGHPPGALLFFVGLERIGLGGGTAAGLACVLLGATISVSVPVALRALGVDDAARAVWPFLVLFPGAVWVGASADGIFAAVVAAGLALLVAGGRPGAAVGGLLLGVALYLSYGFVLVGVLALAVVLLRARDRLGVLLVAATAVAAVVAVFTVAGFWWLDGYHLVARRYYQGWAAERPYGYWVWANLAALLLSAGPVVGPALRRAVAAVAIRPPHPPRAIALRQRIATAGPTVWLPIAAAAAVLAADLSGLSKAEVERIWLPFAVWLLVATAHLPSGHRRWWLAAQAATALAVNHLLWTVS